MKLNAKSLEGLLRLREFSIPRNIISEEELKDSEVKKMEACNRILGRSFHHTFEKWERKFGRIPTPQEFVAMQMQDIRKLVSNEGYRNKYHIKFHLTPAVERGLKSRLIRSYVSFIIELHTELQIKRVFPKLIVEKSDCLDYSGIDLCVIDRINRIEHLIHITKSTARSVDYLFRKEGKVLQFKPEGQLWSRPVWTESSNQVYKQRSFKGHTFFLYYPIRNNTTDGTIKMVNGYPLFTIDFIRNKIEISKKIKIG